MTQTPSGKGTAEGASRSDKASAAPAASFWSHIDELRRVILRMALVFAVFAVAAFCFMPAIFEKVIMAPCSAQFPTYRLFEYIAGEASSDFSVDVVSLELTSQIFVHMSAAGWLALTAAFPILIILLWSFISPGLYEHERRGAVKAFIWGVVMFYLGVAVAYFLIFPLTLRFLATYSLSSAVRPMISLESYMDNFFMLELIMGAVFEFPVLAWLLGRMGILRRGFFSRWRRHAIIVLLVIAALITPTGDPFTLFIVFIPIYALWEASALIVPKEEEDNI